MMQGVEVQIPSHSAKPCGYVLRHGHPPKAGGCERGKMEDETYVKVVKTWKWWDGDSVPYSWIPIGNESLVFSDSQFFPARDGSWLMVDWMSGSGNWYVTEVAS